MQIQLKQDEIIDALKQYISRKGISLTNKEVIIGFTAGRKQTGLSADISIEDPAFPLPSDEPPKPTLTVVQSPPVFTPDAAVPIAAPTEPTTEPPAGKSLFS